MEVIDWKSGRWVVNGTCSVVDTCPRCPCVVCKLEDRDTIKMRRGDEVSSRVASSGRLHRHRPPPFPPVRTSPSRLNGPTPSSPPLVWTDISSAWRLTFSSRPPRARDGALLHRRRRPGQSGRARRACSPPLRRGTESRSARILQQCRWTCHQRWRLSQCRGPRPSRESGDVRRGQGSSAEVPPERESRLSLYMGRERLMCGFVI